MQNNFHHISTGFRTVYEEINYLFTRIFAEQIIIKKELFQWYIQYFVYRKHDFEVEYMLRG